MTENVIEFRQTPEKPTKQREKIARDVLMALRAGASAGDLSLGPMLSSDAFASWKAWCEQNGEAPGSNRAFTQALTSQDIRKGHSESGTAFYGIRLIGRGS